MPERRGWTPNELRRLKETDPERYERVVHELDAQLGIGDWIRTVNEAARATIRIAPAPEPAEIESPEVSRARLEAERHQELVEALRAGAPRRPPLPADANRYTDTELQQAVALLEDGATDRAVERETAIARRDAPLVRRLWAHQFLTLNGARALEVDDNVGFDGEGYVLRLFDERIWDWVKPPELP